jgi:hypothetical protein
MEAVVSIRYNYWLVAAKFKIVKVKTKIEGPQRAYIFVVPAGHG